MSGPVRQLMAGEVIQAVRNEDILVDVKRRCDPLRKHVCDIVVGVSAVVELGAEGALPLLCGDLIVSIRCVENESLELQLADATESGPDLES